MAVFNLVWIEEPLPSDDHGGLRRLAEIPAARISGGEELTTVQFLAGSPGGDLVEFSESTSPPSLGLVTNPVSLRNGKVAVADAPGLGIELDEDLVAKYRVKMSLGA